jgi:predicted MFS family arabinose efflux permease
MAVVMLPLPFVGGLWLLAVTLFVAGGAISPTLVATIALVDETVPSSRLTEGITWVTTGLELGVAAGAAVAGQMVDAWGASPSYWVSVASGALAAVVAWANRPARRLEDDRHIDPISPIGDVSRG